MVYLFVFHVIFQVPDILSHLIFLIGAQMFLLSGHIEMQAVMEMMFVFIDKQGDGTPRNIKPRFVFVFVCQMRWL